MLAQTSRLIESDEMGFFFTYTFSLILIYFTKYSYSLPLKYFFLFCYLIRLIDSAIGYVRFFNAHLYNSTLILQPSATNRNCPSLDLKTRLTTPVEIPADVRQVNSKMGSRNSFHFMLLLMSFVDN